MTKLLYQKTIKRIALQSLILCLILIIISCADNPPVPEQQVYDRGTYDTVINLETDHTTIYGTLQLPGIEGKTPVVLIIPGSGPTDRNGNNSIGLQTNSYKILSDSLANHGIATVRYDKRGVGKSAIPGLDESDLLFDHYIEDAVSWIELLKQDDRFDQYFIVGHSEGSLIGMVVSQQVSVSGFISIAGTAQRIDSLILKQLSSQPENIQLEAAEIFHSLENGIVVQHVSPALQELFRPSVQPYMVSWMQYDPKEEISKINVPILIVHGLVDLQVDSREAITLGIYNEEFTKDIVLIDGMNHVLKYTPDSIENISSYSNPRLPLASGLTQAIVEFIHSN